MTPPSNALQPDAPLSPVASALLGHTVLLVTGKGGVGKSTVTVAMARLAAQRGQRVLLVELESVSRVGPLFGVAQVGPDPVEVDRRLWVSCLDSSDSLRYFVTQQLKVTALVNLALRNRSVEGFFKATPAIKPMLFLYHLWRIEQDHGRTGDGRYDLIICDLPTSGFAHGMYAIPDTLAHVFRVGSMATYAEGMRAMLTTPGRAGLVLVTLPEEMPVTETLELRAALQQRHGVETAAIVVNGMYPHLVGSGDVTHLQAALAHAEGAGREPVSEWLWAARLLAGRSDRALGFVQQLRKAMSGRVVELPFLFRRDLPLDAIDHLAHRFGASSEGAP